MTSHFLDDIQKKRCITSGVLMLLFQFCFFLFVSGLKTSNMKHYCVIAPFAVVLCFCMLVLTIKTHGDYVLTFIFSVLLQLGIALQGSMGGLPIFKTVFILILSVAAAAVCLVLDRFISEKYIRKHQKKILIILSGIYFGLLLFLIVFGKEKNHTRAWIRLFGFDFQATELLKLLFPCILSCLLVSNQFSDRFKLLFGTVFMTVTALLMWKIGELGTLLVLGVVYLIMVFLTLQNRKLVIRYMILLALFALVLLASVLVLSILLKDSPHFSLIAGRLINRWNLFMHPERNQQENVQMIDAQRAVTLGGLLGSRCNNSIINQETDMILPYLIMRLGILVGFCTIGAFLLFYIRSQRSLLQVKDPYVFVFCTTASNCLMIQTLIISFGSLNFIPLTGIPLPLLSEGGAAMVVNFVLFGLLIRHTCNIAAFHEFGICSHPKRSKSEKREQPVARRAVFDPLTVKTGVNGAEEVPAAAAETTVEPANGSDNHSNEGDV